ncbi:bleomycin hydrolase [Exophiala xenobiotica]|nr:bleomycin hydrolase [Exophiala xenobiotica]KAK5281062.1 bleomycin hydrolase [Exophiala xenobiotica]KAK5374582.1 bleomycin hydrolase [Exophiala xenobiotica]KAK5396732.1 bleomycin hydrolase [Exophiala xenobiotica]KAK5470611.1 bleomycin hydrolase [Exophiala xenobiotica]
MKKYNLQAFELSEAYLFFCDKIEKANWFLEQMIDTAGQELSSIMVQDLLGSPVGDGEQWDMAANLVNQYGLVPQKLYPDSEDDARNPLHSYPHAGPPPKPDERFPWEFYDKDDKYQNFSMPPLELLKQLSNPSVVIALGGADVPKMFSLVNDPRNNKYMSRLTLERLGNVMGGRLVKACRYWNISEHTGR